MSSICSRNDQDQALSILRDRKILEYFIFPSISWQPKGARLSSLIESMQLRPASVMFIDDSPSNLAEACATVPGIQVEGADFIGRMLEDPRFKGKNDAALRRLAQYQLLETRKRDEVQHSGDNSEFLRGCDIRVSIEHDVLGHLDRAVELINRTNQLNYTKNRLPEAPEAARVELRRQCTGRQGHRQAGLVRVVDKYGDYGFVGFYLMRNRRRLEPGHAKQTLMHYCFSCRTLGMYVEHWLYDHLRRPALTVVGEVLTDLSEPRTIDWLRLVPSISGEARADSKLASEIRVCGGCEANPLGHYLGAYCDGVSVTSNFSAGALFVRINSCFLLVSAADHVDSKAYEEEMSFLGFSAPLMGTRYFRNAPEGTIFVFNGGMDPFKGIRRVRHRLHGWEIHVTCRGGSEIMSSSEEDIGRTLRRAKSDDERRQLELVTRHIRENYEVVGEEKGDALESAMKKLVNRVPKGSKLIILLDDERRRTPRGEVRIKRERARYNEWARSFAARFPFVGVVSFADVIESEDEILEGGNHYARMVYWRAAEKIVEVTRQLKPKQYPAANAAIGDAIARLEEPIGDNLPVRQLRLERF
jgi:FkbH-like protein